MKKTLLILTLGFMALTVQAKDIKKVEFTTIPQMHCENCENRIKNNLKYEKGVKLVETNIAEQKVTVTYDADKTSEETLREAFSKFNYEAHILKKGEKVPTQGTTSCSNM